MNLIITHELIESGKTAAGAWTRKQLKVLGVSWPPVKGWKTRIVEQNNTITEEQYQLFLRLRKESPSNKKEEKLKLPENDRLNSFETHQYIGQDESYPWAVASRPIVSEWVKVGTGRELEQTPDAAGGFLRQKNIVWRWRKRLNGIK